MNLPNWSGWGGGIYNNRSEPNSGVRSVSVKNLTEHCRLPYPIGVSATPTVWDNMVYYPSWNGSIVALDYTTCYVQWQTNVTDIITSYAPVSEIQHAVAAPVSRTGPQIESDNGVLYVGTLTHALLLALDLKTGSLLGQIQLNPHPVAMITQSPTFYKGQIFVGASSAEETAANITTYQCCSFVGNFAALTFTRTNISTGFFSVSWNITMLPQPQGLGGWSGAAVWGSQPSIDIRRNQVFIATGNVYFAPPAIQACQNATESGAANSTSCLPPNVWQESVLAIDIPSGHVNWVDQLSPLDAWTLACGNAATSRNFANCPETPGIDADFGMAPTFVPSSLATTPNNSDVVVVGQKNGNLYALDAVTGVKYWAVVTSPDSSLGGLSWGIAVDDARAYFTAINFFDERWTLQPSNISISNSAWGAANLVDGTTIWETAVPGNSSAYSPPSVTEDVVLAQFVGSDLLNAFEGLAAQGSRGSLVVLGKETGAVLAEYQLDTLGAGGIAVHGDYLMFGSGYPELSSNGSFYVLKVVGSWES